jgi:hypothetical protein
MSSSFGNMNEDFADEVARNLAAADEKDRLAEEQTAALHAAESAFDYINSMHDFWSSSDAAPIEASGGNLICMVNEHNLDLERRSKQLDKGKIFSSSCVRRLYFECEFSEDASTNDRVNYYFHILIFVPTRTGLAAT